MTQSNDMTQIRDALVYARDEAERADERIKYKQALNALGRITTPPQSPNRAVLDALRSISSMGHGKGVRGAVCVTTSMLAQIADQALAANQADEVKVIDGLEEAIEEMDEFEWDAIGVLKNIILLHNKSCTCNASCCDFCMAHNVYNDANKHWPTVMKAAVEHLKRQKER